MHKIKYLVVLIMLLFVANISAQQNFTRTAQITDPSMLERGFGEVLAGLDIDGDGWPEIYAINTNMVDGDYEVIPRIYKFEWNGTTWDSVWGATAPVDLQNTWPTLDIADLDGDGRPELVWTIVNYFSSNLNPYRILVYEYPADGSDNMGVSDGFGAFEPNAVYTIVTAPSLNVRPVRTVIHDIDNDGKDEIIFADRAAASGGIHVGVIGVSDIPNLGGGTEVWTNKYLGSQSPELTGTGNKWDLFILNSTIYLMDGLGNGTSRIYPVKFENGNYTVLPYQENIVNGRSSFKGALTVDVNGDGTMEAIVPEWLDNTVGQGAKVWLVQVVGDTLVSTEIADFEPFGAVRLNGADYGDLDADGNMDFVFGSRYDANNTARVPIFRLEYQGGDLTNMANWQASLLDSGYWASNGDMDVIAVGNLDGDAADEVIYTQGYSRGNATDAPMPMIVLDLQFTPVSVKQESSSVPESFFVGQNYPNPFNPTTNIQFGLTESARVELVVYDALGREVATLISGQEFVAGSYSVNFDATNLATGTYLYRLTASGKSITKKMQLLK
ncbi:MAG: T9SS type A sorting domain-containing protein [Ignavibacteriaceae bacterium]|nr:T9SS type A sorting domain-containing protein [Ignavibacteriaceae bacterium]